MNRNKTIIAKDSKSKKLSILFFFPNDVSKTLEDIGAGRAPSERLYGLKELKEKGWEANICHSRYDSHISALLFRKLGIRLASIQCIKEVLKYDIILIKDEFSIFLTLLSRIFGKKIIYMDSMFDLPRKKIKRYLTMANIWLASTTICYSKSQAQLWSDRLGISISNFSIMNYGIDVDFYKIGKKEPSARPYVIAVGRDLGRDFPTLIEAMTGLDIALKLITLPYLLPPNFSKYKWLEVIENIGYADLFELYANAALSIIPLKRGVTYPSGIRAALESLAVGRIAICTETEVLREYLGSAQGVFFVAAGDIEGLRSQIKKLVSDNEQKAKTEEQGKSIVSKTFGMDSFARDLERIITS